MTENQQVKHVGEQGLLSRLQAFSPEGMLGDDGALLPSTGDESLVVTTDMLVDGVHFSLALESDRPQTTTPFDVGWRSATANLSDLAAMGAAPIGITICLGLPGNMPVAWVDEMYEGLSACLGQYQVPIVGGDICASPVVTVAIAAFGTVLPDLAIRRSTAQVGDAIVVTGLHGASRAGLELLLSPEVGDSLSEGDRQQLIKSHQRPVPRLDVVPMLHSLFSNQASENPFPWRVAGMDSSDGLADAVLQICRASAVGAQLQRSQLPIPPVFLHWLTSAQGMEWVLYGGEDFELVLCMPIAIATSLVTHLGGNAAIIGTITARPEVIVTGQTAGSEGVPLPNMVLTLEQGFQHFG